MSRSSRTSPLLAGPPAAAGPAPARRPRAAGGVPTTAARPPRRTVPGAPRRAPAPAWLPRHLPAARPWADAAGEGAEGAA